MALTLTGAEVLTHARETTSPMPADKTAWAAVCAAAVLALVTRRTEGVTLSAGQESELKRAALQAAAAAYQERDAPHGIMSMGPDGETVRLSSTLGKSMEPLFQQLFGPGIG